MGPLPVPDKLHKNPCLSSLDSEMRPDRKQKGLDFAPVPDQLISSLPSSVSRNLVGEDPTEITLQVFQDGPVGVVNAHSRHVLEIPSVDDSHFRENQTALRRSATSKIRRAAAAFVQIRAYAGFQFQRREATPCKVPPHPRRISSRI